MQERIQAALKAIEEDKDVTILWACETGSRAWGFPSPDSDQDVRIIYRHKPEWYVSVWEKRDTIEYMSEDKMLDVVGWDIRKCLQLLWKSNAPLLERIQSPVIYREVAGFISPMMAVAEACYSPISTMYHYLGMAKKTFGEVEGADEVRLKKLFYALRAAMACKWIMDKDTMPPIEFGIKLKELELPADLLNRIEELIALKATKNEDYTHGREPLLIDFIAEQIDLSGKAVPSLGSRRDNSVDLDAFLQKAIQLG